MEQSEKAEAFRFATRRFLSPHYMSGACFNTIPSV